MRTRSTSRSRNKPSQPSPEKPSAPTLNQSKNSRPSRLPRKAKKLQLEVEGNKENDSETVLIGQEEDQADLSLLDHVDDGTSTSPSMPNPSARSPNFKTKISKDHFATGDGNFTKITPTVKKASDIFSHFRKQAEKLNFRSESVVTGEETEGTDLIESEEEEENGEGEGLNLGAGDFFLEKLRKKIKKIFFSKKNLRKNLPPPTVRNQTIS